jgi:valyl-tRNA synthetase
MGHGFQVSIMDALVRYHRLLGRRVLWQGGTDHAGIATQMVVERQLHAAGKQRENLSREALLSLITAWKNQSEQRINEQLQRLGASIDVSRNRFTLDADFNQAVVAVFTQLYEEGLLYRGKRLVN